MGFFSAFETSGKKSGRQMAVRTIEQPPNWFSSRRYKCALASRLRPSYDPTMSRLDERDIAQLRFLSSNMAAQPQNAPRSLAAVVSVAKRPAGHPLLQVLAEIETQFNAQPAPLSLRSIWTAAQGMERRGGVYQRAAQTIKHAVESAERE